VDPPTVKHTISTRIKPKRASNPQSIKTVAVNHQVCRAIWACPASALAPRAPGVRSATRGADGNSLCDTAPFLAWTVLVQPGRYPNRRLVTTLRCLVALKVDLLRVLGPWGSSRLGGRVVQGRSEEEGGRPGEREPARKFPPFVLFLKRLDTAALLSADRGAGELAHSTPGLILGADRAPCFPGSAWATRLAGLPDCLIQDTALTYDSIILAPDIRAPIEDEYSGWLAGTVSRVKVLAAPPAYPYLLYMPIPGPYWRRLPILPPSSHASSEQRAHRRRFSISWNRQEF